MTLHGWRRLATASLVVLALLYALYAVAGVVLLERGQYYYRTVIANSANATAICALLLYCARGILRGKRTIGTLVLLCYLGIQIVVATALIATAERSLAPILLVIVIVYVIDWILAFFAVAIAKFREPVGVHARWTRAAEGDSGATRI